MKVIVAHDLPSDLPGKTWKEKNLEIQHNIPIGALVEISAGFDYDGVRLIVCNHTRDCDGTPLYSLTWDMDNYERFKELRWATTCTGGYSEQNLVIIKQPGSTAL